MNKVVDAELSRGVRHFLANLLTILNFEIKNEGIDNERKEIITDHLNMVSVIISNEEIFLDKKPAFFMREIYLDGIVEIACLLQKEKIKKKGVKISLPDSDAIVVTDKYYFGEAIKYLIEALVEQVSVIDFQYDEEQKILYMIHDKDNFLSNYCNETGNSLIDCLNVKNLDYKRICCRLSLQIFETLGMNVEFVKNEVKICLH